MSVDATLVYGMRFYYSGDGVSYTEVVDLKDMGPPGNPEAPDVDVTPLTPSAAAREFKAGLINGGEMDFKQFWNKTRHATMYGFLRLSKYWRVTFPDNATPSMATRVDFQGYLKACTTSGSGTPDDPITIDGKIKVNTIPTVTQGS